jgi:hypothetical protein
MQRVNTFSFYLLGKWLDSCFLSARLPLKSNIGAFYSALALVDLLQRGDVDFKLDESWPAASQLRGEIADVIAQYMADSEATLPIEKLERFNAAFSNFEQAFNLELGRAPIFWVTPKGVFETRKLMVDGAAVYEGYRDRIPQKAIDDTNDAGRCLAFALPTAAAFHIARATESVMVRYMEVLQCPQIAVNSRSWGAYIKALATAKANERVVEHLRQLKNLHRNPLMHPEVRLHLPEAISLWSMCVSAIQAMVADMESRSPIPKNEITRMLSE